MILNVSWLTFCIWSSFICSSYSSWMSSLSDSFYSSLSSVTEVCHRPSIDFNIDALEEKLKSKVVGQPFVFNVALPVLRLHLIQKNFKRKALVISFHGTPGSGKNYVSKIIAESIYKNGVESKFVHLFKPIIHFADQSPDILKANIQQWIIGNVTACPHQLFIFDEINDMPEGILDALKPFVDYNPRFDGLDFSHSIFLLLSNIAMGAINRKFLDLWKSGNNNRAVLKYDEFLNLIIENSFNEKGGFMKSNIISSRLIDAFIPFVPLERPHVAHCIRELATDYSNLPVPQKVIDNILDKVDFSPSDIKAFATHGCKNLETYVKLFVVVNRSTDEL